MKWASRGLALLLPVAVLAVSLGALSSTVSGQKSEERQRMEVLLSTQDTKVLVLGNSMAKRDLDMEALAAELGLAAGEVTRLVVPLSRLKTWHAMLRHPVFGEGHRPELVILASTLEDLIEESGGEDRDRLWEWIRLAGEEPEPGTLLERARAKGVGLRAQMLTGIRDMAVGMVFGGDRAYAESALEEVFGADGVTDISLHSRVVPVVEEASDDWSGDGTDATVAGGEGSERIQAFVQLAQAHGAQVLFVRLPVSPVSRADKIDPALQRGALAVLGELGVGYLDLRDDSLGEEAFEGPVHLSAEGRTRLTQELGQQLGALGLHRGKAPPPVSVPSGPQRRP